MALFTSPTSHRTYTRHASGALTHYLLSDFTPPWKPSSSRETILIQHGFARHSAFWYDWVPVFARKYRVVRRDVRGHGYSSYDEIGGTGTETKTGGKEKGEVEGKEKETPKKLTLDTILSEIIDTLDALNIDKVHFLGESTSGTLGLILASQYPDRIASLTLCSSPLYLPPSALSLFAFEYTDWPSACRALGARGWAEQLAKIPGTIPISDPEYLPWYLEQVGISSGEGLAQYAEFLSSLDARPYVGRVKCETLVLAPGESAAVKVEDMVGLKGEIEGAGGSCKVHVVQGGGHEIYVTRGEECQGVVLEFLERLKQKGKTSTESQ